MQKNASLERGRKLFPHQEDALAFCRRAGTGVALFMEMRLGKTKVTIEWLRSLEGKVLVVAPLTVLRAWEGELRAEGEFPPVILSGSSNKKLEAFNRALAGGVKYFLVNYEGLIRIPWILANYRWAACVLDESTRIKNPQAQVTKLLVKYRLNFDRRVVLTGKPAPEGPLDYCEQFRFLFGSFMGFESYWSYRNCAFYPVARGYNWIMKKPFEEKLRNFVQKNAFVLSRKQAGMANEKIYETRIIQMEPEQKRIMEKLEQEFALELPNEEKTTNWIPVQLAWMARLAGGYLDGKKWFDAKFVELEKLLETELRGDSVVVWFRFNSELRRAERRLAGKTCVAGVGAIDGTTPEDERARLRGAFQEGRIQVLLLQSKVGMFGLDLSHASTTIYFSNNYSGEVRSQSEDRIEHPLKKESLLIIDLITAGTVDEDVLRALKRKHKESDRLLLTEVADAARRRAACRQPELF
jgi:SNF2 family DNA or RNA helicase